MHAWALPHALSLAMPFMLLAWTAQHATACVYALLPSRIFPLPFERLKGPGPEFIPACKLETGSTSRSQDEHEDSEAGSVSDEDWGGEVDDDDWTFCASPAVYKSLMAAAKVRQPVMTGHAQL